MFTWRHSKFDDNKQVSPLYFKNTINLLQNSRLNYVLKQNNITLYFVFHRYIYSYKSYQEMFVKIMKNNEHLKFLSQDDISQCISRADLVITDFSSILFDLIARNKPYIIYIPDGEDKDFHHIYNQEYIEILGMMKNGTIKFPNHLRSVYQVVDKAIYYINNNYTLDRELASFYKEFGFTYGNNTNMFIDYLLNLE